MMFKLEKYNESDIIPTRIEANERGKQIELVLYIIGIVGFTFVLIFRAPFLLFFFIITVGLNLFFSWYFEHI